LKRPERVMALALLVYALGGVGAEAEAGEDGVQLAGPEGKACGETHLVLDLSAVHVGPPGGVGGAMAGPRLSPLRCASWGSGDVTCWSEGVRNVGSTSAGGGSSPS